MSKITYTDKEYIYENASIPEINKITDGNMNEIKSVVNENDTRLTTAEGEIDTAQTDINNAESVIGNETDTYSSSSTYALGSLVIYNSLLYKCTTAITVAEAWTIAHWTQVSLTSEVNDMKAKILWTNPDPTSSIVNVDITLNSNEYDVYEIIFSVYGGDNLTLSNSKSIKGYDINLVSTGYPSTGIGSWGRQIGYINDTKLRIGSCYAFTKETSYTDNSKNIPLYVIGYKTGLFS